MSDEGAAKRELRTEPIPAEAGKIIASYYKNDKVKAHKDYAAAKAGVEMAAARLIVDMVKPETVDAVRRQVGEGAIFAYPHAEEQSGRNAIPSALANYYATLTNGSAADIVQSVRTYHTGAGAMERMISKVSFAGDIVKGGKYVIVDDVSTLGGTIAEMAHYIQSKGGNVAGVALFTNASRNATIIPNKSAIKEIERRFGNEVRELFGIDPKALTAAEAAYLSGFRDAHSLRNRAITARREREERLLSKGIRPAQDEVILPQEKASEKTEPRFSLKPRDRKGSRRSINNQKSRFAETKDEVTVSGIAPEKPSGREELTMANPAIELRWTPGTSPRDPVVLVPEGKYVTLKEAVEQNRDKLQGAYLGGMDLRGVDLTGANLRYAYFGGSRLDGAKLDGADLRESNLRGVNLEGASLKESKLDGANLFSKEEMSAVRGANFEGASLIGTDLAGADLSDVNFRRANFKDANFKDARLDGVNFTGANFERANLEGVSAQSAVFKNANFKRATLNDANFKGTDFEGADFKSADLKGTNFAGANLEGVYLKDANLKDSNFKDAKLTGANLTESYCNGTNFKGAGLEFTNFKDADLFRANLENAQVRASIFKDANLREANFKGVDLSGVNMNGVELEGVKNLETPSIHSYKAGLQK